MFESGFSFNLGWMAWTWPTALFFLFILFLLICMSCWEMIRPGGAPRRGVLGLDTTRGDRLFISLLGSAFIHLAWLFALGTPIWGAMFVSVFYAFLVFGWV